MGGRQSSRRDRCAIVFIEMVQSLQHTSDAGRDLQNSFDHSDDTFVALLFEF
jgi:hypothetical protein